VAGNVYVDYKKSAIVYAIPSPHPNLKAGEGARQGGRGHAFYKNEVFMNLFNILLTAIYPCVKLQNIQRS